MLAGWNYDEYADRVVPGESPPACPPVRPVEAGLAACSAARRRGAAYY
jgi:hypothetical protein